MSGSEENWDFKKDFKVKGDVTATKFIGDGTEITLDDVKLAEIKKAVDFLLRNRLVFGTVSSDGIREAGEGFKAKKITNKIGEYLIEFDPPFSGRPSGSVTQIYPNLDDFEKTGKTTDNAVIGGCNAKKFRVITGDSVGNKADRCFNFIVVGPRKKPESV